MPLLRCAASMPSYRLRDIRGSGRKSPPPLQPNVLGWSLLATLAGPWSIWICALSHAIQKHQYVSHFVTFAVHAAMDTEDHELLDWRIVRRSEPVSSYSIEVTTSRHLIAGNDFYAARDNLLRSSRSLST